jgi:hypothetical protein
VGKIFQRGGWSNAVVDPPPGVKFVQIDTGIYNDYGLGDDGYVYRGRNNGFSAMEAPKEMKFVQLAAGSAHSYFLRDDGIVVRSRGGGRISTEIGDKDTDVLAGKYVSVGSQAVLCQNQYTQGSVHHYLIRADGAPTRVGIWGHEGKAFNPPRGTKYIDATVNEVCAYLLRSDGYAASIRTLPTRPHSGGAAGHVVAF